MESHLSMVRGSTQSFEVVLMRVLEVSAILKGRFPSFKNGGGGARKVLPRLNGGLQKVSDLRFFQFVAPSPTCK